MGLLPWSGLVGLGVFAPVLLLTRYVSLGSLLGIAGAAVLFVVAAVVWGLPLPYLVYALVCGPLIFWTHRDNIQRLLTGKRAPHRRQLGCAGVDEGLLTSPSRERSMRSNRVRVLRAGGGVVTPKPTTTAPYAIVPLIATLVAYVVPSEGGEPLASPAYHRDVGWSL